MDPSVTGGFAMITHQTWFLIGLLVLGVQVANAQPPQRTTAVYDDWVVSCVPPGPGAQKACEAVHHQMIQGQPVGQITIGLPAKSGPLKIFFQVPPNVWLQTGVKFVFDPKAPPFVVPFRWCVSDRCLADAELTDAQVTRLRAQTNPGKVEFKEASQRDVSIPVSFKGFALALDAIRNQ